MSDKPIKTLQREIEQLRALIVKADDLADAAQDRASGFPSADGSASERLAWYLKKYNAARKKVSP